ncbi:hypothetical protein [Sorangium sp. So ce406]|uniref:hypothetical protein n=1 Tax=Sorangium sp. So ce406 TaxID=3133311 RepID=UPI003F5B82A8
MASCATRVFSASPATLAAQSRQAALRKSDPVGLRRMAALLYRDSRPRSRLRQPASARARHEAGLTEHRRCAAPPCSASSVARSEQQPMRMELRRSRGEFSRRKTRHSVEDSVIALQKRQPRTVLMHGRRVSTSGTLVYFSFTTSPRNAGMLVI